ARGTCAAGGAAARVAEDAGIVAPIGHGDLTEYRKRGVLKGVGHGFVRRPAVCRRLAEIQSPEVRNEGGHLLRPVSLFYPRDLRGPASVQHVEDNGNARCVGLVDLVGREDHYAVLRPGKEMAAR